MQIPNQYPLSQAMYPESVTPPAVSPLNEANPVTLGIDCAWWPYIVGAIKSLRQAGTWSTASELDLITVQDYVDSLLEYLTQQILASCAVIPLALACDYNFEASESGWSIYEPSGEGVWVSELGWGGTFVDSEQVQGCLITKHFDPPITLTRFEANVIVGIGGTGPNAGLRLESTDADGDHYLTDVIPLHPDAATALWEGSNPLTSDLYIACGSGEIIGNNYIFFASIEGFSDSGMCI